MFGVHRRSVPAALPLVLRIPYAMCNVPTLLDAKGAGVRLHVSHRANAALQVGEQHLSMIGGMISFLQVRP